jgi:hypothetical protein
MTERLGPYVIKGPLGYRSGHGWTKQRGMALSFEDPVSARDWLATCRPRIGTVENSPWTAEIEEAERTRMNLPMGAMALRSASDYDPFNDGPR